MVFWKLIKSVSGAYIVHKVIESTYTMIDLSTATLLLVDVQVGIDDLFDSPRNNPQAEENIAKMLVVWRKAGNPVVHVKHNSVSPDSPLRPERAGNAFKPEGMPLANEPLFEKTVNSAFIGTDLEKYLKENNVTDLVIAGLTTDHCVSTTTRMAANLGFNVALVSDGTATFGRTSTNGETYTAKQIHEINLASLNEEFCQVVNTKEVLS